LITSVKKFNKCSLRHCRPLLQKTHRKTKTQQKTNDKDGDQASGGKPKEQSSVNKNSGAVIYQVVCFLLGFCFPVSFL
jgi:hypothetical protein